MYRGHLLSYHNLIDQILIPRPQWDSKLNPHPEYFNSLQLVLTGSANLLVEKLVVFRNLQRHILVSYNLQERPGTTYLISGKLLQDIAISPYPGELALPITNQTQSTYTIIPFRTHNNIHITLVLHNIRFHKNSSH